MGRVPVLVTFLAVLLQTGVIRATTSNAYLFEPDPSIPILPPPEEDLQFITRTCSSIPENAEDELKTFCAKPDVMAKFNDMKVIRDKQAKNDEEKSTDPKRSDTMEKGEGIGKWDPNLGITDLIPVIPPENPSMVALQKQEHVQHMATKGAGAKQHLLQQQQAAKSLNPGPDPPKTKYKKWPSSNIPVIFDPSCDDAGKKALNNVFVDIAKCSVVKFYVPAPGSISDSTPAVLVKMDPAITRSASNGIGAPVDVTTNPRAFVSLSFFDETDRTVIAHEFLHAAGLLHTQQRHDREKWLKYDERACEAEFRQMYEKMYENDRKSVNPYLIQACQQPPGSEFAPTVADLRARYVPENIATAYNPTDPTHVKYCVVGYGIAKEFNQWNIFPDTTDYPPNEYDYGSIMHYSFRDCAQPRNNAPVAPCSAYLRPYDCKALNMMYNGRKAILEWNGDEQDIWVPATFTVPLTVRYTMQVWVRLQSSNGFTIQIKHGNGDYTTFNEGQADSRSLQSQGWGQDWSDRGEELRIKVTKNSNRCWTKDNKLYIKATGDCTRTGLFACDDNSDDAHNNCEPDKGAGGCTGKCVCMGHTISNSCECVKEAPPNWKGCEF